MSKSAKSLPKVRLPRRRRIAPTFEPVEQRLLMTGLGFIGGYATHLGGAVDNGATIQLFNSGSSTVPFATTTTNSDGYYHFDGLTPGVYQVAEVEAGYYTSSANASTTINPATAIKGNTAFQVTVVDPSTQTVTITRNADPYTADKVYSTLLNGPGNGYTANGDTTHQYSLGLSGNQGNVSQIISLCSDLYHGVGQGAVYPTTPSLTPQATGPALPPTTSATNLGRIGYLYNHFGQYSTVNPALGAGLQVAIWELLYDTTDDLTSGNYQLVGSLTDPTIVAAAKNYLAASVGKVEDAYFLDVRTPSGDLGGQSMISTDLLNFTNSPTVSLKGYDYLVSNNTTPGSLTTSTTGVPIAGTKITLSGIDIVGNPVNVPAATTNGSGFYSFTGLNPSNAAGYTVTETPPSTYAHLGQTSDTAAAVTTPSSTPVVSHIVLTTANSPSTDKFFETATVSINGVVFLDSNGDCIQQAGESGIPGTKVTLSGIDVFGNPVNVPAATTNGSGFYSFTGLNPSNAAGYTVTETVPNGYVHEGQTSTTAGAITTPLTSPVVSHIVLTTNGATSTDSFCETAIGSISGFVYLDANNNGIKDGGPNPETGIGGVKVTATIVINGVTTTAFAVTAPDGSYSIPNLVAGTYTLTESNVPAAYQPDITNTGSLTGVVVVAAANTPNENFGELLYTPGAPCPITSICYTDYGPCGTSYFSDLGGNTHQGDQVTANFTVTSPVTITLVTYTATGNFDLTKQVVFSVNTETFGVGQHSLTVTIPNGYYQIDLVCGGAIYAFNPSAGVTYHGQNRFIDSDNGGCQTVSGPGALAGISGTIINDKNGDGVLGSGEAGLGGVSLVLTGTDNTGRSVTETRVSATDGTYSFLGLVPGTYSVREVTPPGYLTTRNTVGTVNSTVDGKLSTPSSDTITSIALAAGNTGVGYNFGEQKVTSCPLGCAGTASTGWWAGCSGQSLIKSMNGGSCSTNLGHWLATECPNLFGCLDGKSNAQVAGYFQSQYNGWWTSANAEIMATALAAYATDANLAGGTTAAQYGFTMSPGGSGYCTVDVGSTLSCYGGPQGKVTLFQLLHFVDGESCNGRIAGCDRWEQYKIACLFDQINECGKIG